MLSSSWLRFVWGIQKPPKALEGGYLICSVLNSKLMNHVTRALCTHIRLALKMNTAWTYCIKGSYCSKLQDFRCSVAIYWLEGYVEESSDCSSLPGQSLKPQQVTAWGFAFHSPGLTGKLPLPSGLADPKATHWMVCFSELENLLLLCALRGLPATPGVCVVFFNFLLETWDSLGDNSRTTYWVRHLGKGCI